MAAVSVQDTVQEVSTGRLEEQDPDPAGAMWALKWGTLLEKNRNPVKGGL